MMQEFAQTMGGRCDKLRYATVAQIVVVLVVSALGDAVPWMKKD